MWLSLERSFLPAELSISNANILVKCDDIRSGAKANACNDWLRLAQALTIGQPEETKCFLFLWTRGTFHHMQVILSPSTFSLGIQTPSDFRGRVR